MADMDPEEEEGLIDTFYDKLTASEWPDLARSENEIYINRPERISIVEQANESNTVHLVWYNRRDNQFGVRAGIQKIVFTNDLAVDDFIYFSTTRGYKLSYDAQVKAILQISAGKYRGEVDVLDISPEHNRISLSRRTRTLKIPSARFEEILQDAEEAYKRGSSYGASVERYLVNQFSKKHLNVEIGRTTSIEQGEFTFLIHRLNLKTKKTKADFDRYINTTDKDQLQGLVMTLIKKEVFDADFLRMLDEYFIREKLEEVVEYGREILALRSGDMSTRAALQIKALLDEPRVQQLETLWQRYFEKYLLYLIFSYKDLFPKVKLELDTEKKYPDFLGINHYFGVDVIEIKTHLTPALTWDESHKNFSFSPELSKAIIQVVNYLDAIKEQKFVDGNERQKITDTTYEENLYRPRAIIVISSWENIVKKKSEHVEERIRRDFTKLRNSLHNIEILTFDEILEMADTYRERMVGSEQDTEE